MGEIQRKSDEQAIPGGRLGELIRELQQLRWARDAAEWTLLKRCQQVEEGGEWREAFETFDALLEDFHVCSPRRYRDFVAAEEALGETKELAESAGVPSMLQAAKIKKAEHRALFLEAATERAKATGVPWSDQEAKTSRDKIAGCEPKPSTWNTRASELMELRRQNAALQARVRELEKENAHLRERVPGPAASEGGVKEGALANRLASSGCDRVSYEAPGNGNCFGMWMSSPRGDGAVFGM